MMIDIQVEPLSFKVESSEGAERVDVVKVEENGHSVYYKRRRMCLMEDRYSAVVDQRNDSRQGGYVDCCHGFGECRALLLRTKMTRITKSL